MSEPTFVMQFHGFNDKEAQDIISEAMGAVDWDKYEVGKVVETSHLTNKGIKNLNKYVFAKEEEDE